MPFFSATVPADFQGSTRLDKYIASLPDGMNRSKLKASVSEILLNGAYAKLSAKVAAGDRIDIDWEDNVPSDITPEAIPLDIIYEDENVTVVNKVQGMVTHPASGNWTGTLVNALLYHWGRAGIPQATDVPVPQMLAQRRPGIVHRLDKDTSGVIITAKNRDAEAWLQAQFKTRKLGKHYIAIVTGKPPQERGEIRTQIIRDPKDRRRFKAVTDTESGKMALTGYKLVARYGPYSLLVLTLKTGRTHQIRVHLKYLGCPILGDPLYGRRTTGTPFSGVTMLLHARRLKICLPQETAYTTLKAKTPVRFRKVMRMLHRLYPKTPSGQGR
ncbi:MAG: RluA family pseudouridine synthase [Treponemataceae bacterium]|nr:RluA family pseudouridine synthase [Treponemataceae bacterium]